MKSRGKCKTSNVWRMLCIFYQERELGGFFEDINTVVSLVSNASNLACKAQMCLRCRISTLGEEISFEDHLQNEKKQKNKTKQKKKLRSKRLYKSEQLLHWQTLMSTLLTNTVSKLNLGTHSWRAIMHSSTLSKQKEDANYDAKFPPLTWTKPLGCTMKLPAQTGSCRLKHTCT